MVRARRAKDSKLERRRVHPTASRPATGKQSGAMNKTLKIGAAIVAVCALAVYCTDSSQRERLAKIELQAALAVDVLPPGTEEAWLAYVDRRIAATIRRENDSIQVVGWLDQVLNQTTILSLNMPYKVSCSSLWGGTIAFGNGEDPTVVPIFGIQVHDDNAEAPPALGVNRRSIASEALHEKLCQRMSVRIQQLLDA